MTEQDRSRDDKKGRIITLGMFIIDSFATVDNDGNEVMSDRPDELGGAGTYAILGARMFEPPENVGMVVHHSPESLPQNGELYKRLLSFGSEMWELRDRRLEDEPEHRGCTRGLNIYDPSGVRGFRYLTPPLLLTPKSVMTSPSGSPSRLVVPNPPSVIHAISSAARTQIICDEIPKSWYEAGLQIVWEPVPPSCSPEHLETFKSVIPRVDVFSPNHTEAFNLLSIAPGENVSASIEQATVQLAAMRPKIASVVRSGALGACYASSGSTETHWIRPYWLPADAQQVIDPTGAGNAFLGGLAAGLYAEKDLAEAMMYATVAAGFAVQQAGPPTYDGALWNGERPEDRLRSFKFRKT